MNSTNFKNKTKAEIVELASNKFKNEGDIKYFMQAMEYVFDRTFPNVDFYYDSSDAIFVSDYNGKNRGKIENFIAACSNGMFLEILENEDEEEMMSYIEYWLYLDPYSYDLVAIKSVHRNIKKWGCVCS